MQLPFRLALRVTPLFLVTCGVHAQSPASQPTAEDFTILGWSSVPADVKAIEEIKACGFNVAGFASEAALPMIKQVGIRCILSHPSLHVGDAEAGISDEEVQRRVQAIASKYADDPAVFGYYLRDEPNARMWPALAKWTAAFRKAAPKQYPYINLFPIYANAGQLGTPTYREHVESFAKVVQPKFISYDNYSMMADGSLRDGYFQNLEIVRSVAAAHGLPFWNIVLSNAHFAYAEPSDATFNFQAYTTLAYGARGISYFTYFAPRIGNYRLAPVDQFGNKTTTWYMLRRINLQIQALLPVYVNLKSVNVFHHPDVPSGCADKASSKLVDQLAGGSFVVGEFEGPGGRPFAMVVNKSLKDSCVVSISFKKAGQIMRVSPYDGIERPWVGEDVWLAPGQGMLLGVK